VFFNSFISVRIICLSLACKFNGFFCFLENKNNNSLFFLKKVTFLHSREPWSTQLPVASAPTRPSRPFYRCPSEGSARSRTRGRARPKGRISTRRWWPRTTGKGRRRDPRPTSQRPRTPTCTRPPRPWATSAMCRATWSRRCPGWSWTLF